VPAVNTSRPSSKAVRTTAEASDAEPSKATKACMAPIPECDPTARGSRLRSDSMRRSTRRPRMAVRPSAPR
jgi:hypothetical protein